MSDAAGPSRDPKDVPTTGDLGPGFWAEPRLARALASWHMGKVVAAYRLHPTRPRPLPQGVVGEWAHMTQPQLSRFENGPPTKDLDKLIFWARLLRIPSQLLWFRLPEGDVDSGDDDSVRRRDFLTGVAGAAALGSVGLQFDRSGQRVGSSDVVRLRRRTSRLRRIDDYLGGADTVDMYEAEAAATTHMLTARSYSTPVGRELVGLLAEQRQQAGWAAFDSGQYGRAASHFQASLDAARDVGEVALAANALALLAYQRATEGVPDAPLAAGSSDLSTSTASRARALVLERQAWTHAVRGDARDVDHLLGAAHVALNDRSGEPSPDWAHWVDEAEIQIMSGRCWAELGQHTRAIPVLESVLSGYDDAHARDKALYLTWLAKAYADAGEVEKAASTLAGSLDLAADVGSIRPLGRVRAVVRQMPASSRSAPSMASVVERLATAGTT